MTQINQYIKEAKLDNDFLLKKEKIALLEKDLSEKVKSVRYLEGEVMSLKKQVEMKNKTMYVIYSSLCLNNLEKSIRPVER